MNAMAVFGGICLAAMDPCAAFAVTGVGAILGALAGFVIASKFNLKMTQDIFTGMKVGDQKVTQEGPGCGCLLVCGLTFLAGAAAALIYASVTIS